MKNLIKSIGLAGFTGILLVAFTTRNQTLPSGNQIMEKVNARNEGEHVVQNLKMILTNNKGKTQVRNTRSYRRDYPDVRKTILVYTAPANVNGTAFMSYDYNQTDKEDDQWLYLPALRKTRRISAANRGDYFLGTDFTYEDIKLGTKMSPADYNYKTLKTESIAGKLCYLVEGIPKTEKIARELGYSKIHQWVDKDIWMVRQSKYWDIAGNPLKTTFFKKIEKIQSIWTFQAFEATNHKTGHKTAIELNDSDYQTIVPDDLFTEESLIRGVK